jgi:hypothetical protein
LTLKLVLVSFSEMIDGCRALLAIANVTTPFVFDNLLKSLRYFDFFGRYFSVYHNHS